MTKEISQYYKICILDTDGLPKYYLLFISGENLEKREFFSNVEWEFIEEKQLQENIFICRTTQIHKDDSIQTLKKKIKRELTQNHITTDEMYLFVTTLKSFHTLSIYKRLTKNDTVPITKQKMNQFIMNYYGLETEEPGFLHHPLYETKDEFVYEDLLEFEWFYSQNATKPKKIPLGFRFVENKSGENLNLNQDLFSSNPFDILFPMVYRPSQDIILQSFDLDFLFRYGDFIENTIYVCMYSDVKTFLTNHNNTNDILDIYFPFYESNQNSQQTEKDESFWEEQRLIDTILSISNNISNSNSNFKTFGISNFRFIIHPDNKNQLPLETIFKNIHTSIQIPMIQYNPGLRREKIYRLYYQQIAQNGNKIPLLNHTVIDKLTDKPGKIANITMFVLTSSDTFIQISFESNGNISVQGELTYEMMPDELNEWLSTMINPAIQTLNDFTQSSGYFIRPFNKIQEDFIEIISLQYNAKITDLKKKIDIEKYMGLFSPFFYNELATDTSDKKKENSKYKRYKRIEYFQKMNLHDEFISELLRLTQNKQMIQKELWKKFRNDTNSKLVLSLEKAGEVLDIYADKHRNAMIPSRYTNAKIEILEHIGFRTSFSKLGDFDNEWNLEVKGIIHLEYIYLLHSILKTLFYVTQHPEIIPKDILQKYEGKRNIMRTPISNKPLPFIPSQVVVPIFYEPETEIDETIPVQKKEEGNISEADVDADSDSDSDSDSDGDSIFILQQDDDEEEENEEDEENEENEEKEKRGGKKKKNKDDDDDEDEDDDDDEEERKKPLKTLSNYFTRRIKQRNRLYSSSGFARACPANEKRHPIILTEQEKKKIDQEFIHSDSKPYTHSLKYGVDSETQNPLYYICPEYWCVKPGQEGPLTQEQVDNKKCGEIIQDHMNIKPGEYTYKGKEGNNDPGVVNRKVQKNMKIDKTTGKGICYPCCFPKWHGKLQNERRFKEQCLPDTEEGQVQVQGKPVKEKKILPPSNVRNILAMNYIPLPYGRIGLLQFPIQLFLNATTANLCIDSSNKPKLNCPILVRYGVAQPQYSNQYFLGCLADMYAYQHNIQNKIITIPEIREIICKAINLDKFVQLHNATLVSLFRYRKDDFLTIEENESVSNYIDKYKDTQLYKRLNLDDGILGYIGSEEKEKPLDFFKSTVLSYEHFLEYLRDDTIVIEYTYLWEIICEKNPALLPYGLNLVILEITNHDVTNNVDLICPTSVYNSQLYDPLKETFIIVKDREFYEPVYLYEITSLNPEIISYKKSFASTSDPKKDIAGLNVILKMIHSWTLQCTPSNKKKNTVFTKNIMADKILSILREIGGYSISKQILNYQHKIIGFIVVPKAKATDKTTDKSKKATTPNAKENNTFFLPVFPSSSIKNIPTKWMDEPDIWNNYDNTVHLLKELYLKSEKRILCQPLFRVLEDEKIVGILTMTNQFIQILPYEDNIDIQDGLKNLDNMNYITADMDIFTTNTNANAKKTNAKTMTSQPFSELSEKEKMVQYIRLENQFYSAFRNTIRLQLNLYKSRNTRDKIQRLIFQKDISFPKKLNEMKTILLEFMDGFFSFQEYDDNVLSNIREVFSCQQDNCLKEPYCLLQNNSFKPVSISSSSSIEEEKCQLILPKYNLINRESLNQNIYFTKLSDELIRHKRIRLIMLYPENYLYVSNAGYNIHEDSEFILPKSELNKKYFEALEPYSLPKYVNTNTYETAISSTEKYTNPTQIWEEKYREERT